jgi:hypothetical protein
MMLQELLAAAKISRSSRSSRPGPINPTLKWSRFEKEKKLIRYVKKKEKMYSQYIHQKVRARHGSEHTVQIATTWFACSDHAVS